MATDTPQSYLDCLNPQQRAAVEYVDGPQLVIAGAGSGKTRVLTYKIVHLLAKGYEPWRILALTFTNKAAREMRDRITDRLGDHTANRIHMGTFHSVFARLLRNHADRLGYKPNYTIYDAQDSKNLIKNIIKSMQLDEKVYKASTVANIISSAKNRLQSPADYVNDSGRMYGDKQAGRPLTAAIYNAYAQRLKTAGAMDFDDLLFNTYTLLRDNQDIRNHYNEFFRYILVDEYQDTNYAQHAIIKLLTGASQHLCVVGDDAQSIYSFRGANLSNILSLKSDYRNLKMFKLEQNYRSTESIINAAGSLIEKNIEQIPKNVFSTNGKGKPVEVVQCYSDFEEAGLLASKIAAIKTRTGDPYDDFAVLYRTNAQSRVLEESLRKRNIPYRIYGGLSFFQRKEVKDAVAYLRLALNPSDEEAIRRIINVPPRKIGDTTVGKVSAVATQHNVSLYDVLLDPETYPVDVNKPTRTRLHDFAAMLADFVDFAKDKTVADLVEHIYAVTGLVEQYSGDTTPENISKAENLAELLNYARRFVEDKIERDLDTETSLPWFMADVSLATDMDKNENAATDEVAVTLMTIHAAKGLEFGNVFVVGVEKELMPSRMCTSPREIEEERRLLYVAITRAKRYCMLSYAMSRYINGATAVTGPSPFLYDIDPGFINQTAGTALYKASPAARSLYGGYGSPRSHKPSTTYAKPTAKPTPAPMANGMTPAHHTSAECREGMRIQHSRFGYGTITNVDATNPGGERITVNFDNEESKTLLLRFALFVICK